MSGSVFEVIASVMIGASPGLNLGVDRRRRQSGRQQIARRVDRRLHLLLGDVETEVSAELQSDRPRLRRSSSTSSGRARHLPELPLERRRHRRGHDLRAGAREKGLNLNGRIIHIRQRRERQRPIGEDAGERQIATISSEVAIGRYMNIRDGFIEATRLGDDGAVRRTL